MTSNFILHSKSLIGNFYFREIIGKEVLMLKNFFPCLATKSLLRFAMIGIRLDQRSRIKFIVSGFYNDVISVQSLMTFGLIVIGIRSFRILITFSCKSMFMFY